MAEIQLAMVAILAQGAALDANLAAIVVTLVGLLLIVAWLLGLYR